MSAKVAVPTPRPPHNSILALLLGLGACIGDFEREAPERVVLDQVWTETHEVSLYTRSHITWTEPPVLIAREIHRAREDTLAISTRVAGLDAEADGVVVRTCEEMDLVDIPSLVVRVVVDENRECHGLGG